MMSDAIEGYQGTVIIIGSNITNLSSVNDLDGLVAKEMELTSLKNLDKTFPKYGLEIDAEKNIHTHRRNNEKGSFKQDKKNQKNLWSRTLSSETIKISQFSVKKTPE